MLNHVITTSRSYATLLFKYRYMSVLIAILLLTVFMRFHDLSGLPPGLHPDEAANGLDIVQRIFKGDLRVIYNTNGPRESLFIFSQAIFVKILGNTIVALRVAPALYGSLAVLTTYLWSRQWFGAKIALISAFLMAVNPWAITLSRNGFRASMTPFIITITLWLYTKALRNNSRKYAILSGISLGAGIYTYLSYRIFLLIVLILAAYLLSTHKNFFVSRKRVIATSLVAALIVFVPFLRYTYLHPDEVSTRVAGTSVLNESLNGGHTLKAIYESVSKTALMFAVRGDGNYRHNFAGRPALNVFVWIFFLVGIIVVIHRRRRSTYVALFLLLAGMLLPSALTYEGVPHFLRAIGSIPFTTTLSAIGLLFIAEHAQKFTKGKIWSKHIPYILIAFVCVFSLLQGYKQYYIDWAHSPNTYEAYSEDMVAEARHILTHKEKNWYVVVDPYNEKVITYLTWDKASYTQLDATQVEVPPNLTSTDAIIISNKNSGDVIATLTKKYPNADLRPVLSDFNHKQLFVVMSIR